MELLWNIFVQSGSNIHQSLAALNYWTIFWMKSTGVWLLLFSASFVCTSVTSMVSIASIVSMATLWSNILNSSGRDVALSGPAPSHSSQQSQKPTATVPSVDPLSVLWRRQSFSSISVRVCVSTRCPAAGLLVIFIPIWWDQNQPRTMVSVGGAGAGDCNNRKCPLFPVELQTIVFSSSFQANWRRQPGAWSHLRAQVCTLGTMQECLHYVPGAACRCVLPGNDWYQSVKCPAMNTKATSSTECGPAWSQHHTAVDVDVDNIYTSTLYIISKYLHCR